MVYVYKVIYIRLIYMLILLTATFIMVVTCIVNMNLHQPF